MTNNIHLIAFGTFGNPNGFKQTFFVGNHELTRSIKPFDLNTNAIKLFPNSKIYALRKENGINAVSYSEYTFAKEQNSDRSGTFIGSSILFVDQIPDENITITQLNDFHNQLVSKNVLNDTINVDHSDKFSVTKPKDFDKIAFHLRKITNLNFKQSSNAVLVVYCSTSDSSLIYFFKKSLELLNRYDIIYFTSSNEIAEYVHQKSIFKLIQNFGERKDFEKEISNLMDEIKRKKELAILDFEKEEQRIIDAKNAIIHVFKIQIQQNENEHSQNERNIKESIGVLNKVSLYYDAFLDATRRLTNEIRKEDVDIDQLNQEYNNNKLLFNSGLNDFKSPNYVTKIKKIKTKDKLPTEQITDLKNNSKQTSNGKTVKKHNKTFIYKMSTLFFAFLFLSTWIYFLFIHTNAESNQENQKNLGNIELTKPVVELEKIPELNPVSNSNLTVNDYRLLAKNIPYNMAVGQVVKVIFDKNPTEIKNYYINQEENYSKHLIELNKQCFEQKEGIYYFTRDTLKVIPSFKK